MPSKSKTTVKKMSATVQVAIVTTIGTIIVALITGFFALAQKNNSLPSITDTPIPASTEVPIYFSPDGTITITSEYRDRFPSGIQTNAFLAKVTVFAPYSTDKGKWDAGFAFGDNNLLIVTSSGYWSLRPNKEKTLPMQLSLQEGSPTSLSLMIYENKGCFFVNNNFVAQLDLSNLNTLGEVSLVTGNFEGNSLPNETASLRFSNFEIYAIESFKCP